MTSRTEKQVEPTAAFIARFVEEMVPGCVSPRFLTTFFPSYGQRVVVQI